MALGQLGSGGPATAKESDRCPLSLLDPPGLYLPVHLTFTSVRRDYTGSPLVPDIADRYSVGVRPRRGGAPGPTSPPQTVPEGAEVMGFAFEDATGLPVIVEPRDPGTAGSAAFDLHIQPEPTQSPEVEIGDIMLKVQQFADETAEDARRQARSVIADAQVEAASIVARARREAEEITDQAAPRSLPRLSPSSARPSRSSPRPIGCWSTSWSISARLSPGSYSDTPVSPSRPSVRSSRRGLNRTSQTVRSAMPGRPSPPTAGLRRRPAGS